jgi:hypothetical protein
VARAMVTAHVEQFMRGTGGLHAQRQLGDRRALDRNRRLISHCGARARARYSPLPTIAAKSMAPDALLRTVVIKAASVGAASKSSTNLKPAAPGSFQVALAPPSVARRAASTPPAGYASAGTDDDLCAS